MVISNSCPNSNRASDDPPPQKKRALNTSTWMSSSSTAPAARTLLMRDDSWTPACAQSPFYESKLVLGVFRSASKNFAGAFLRSVNFLGYNGISGFENQPEGKACFPLGRVDKEHRNRKAPLALSVPKKTTKAVASSSVKALALPQASLGEGLMLKACYLLEASNDSTLCSYTALLAQCTNENCHEPWDVPCHTKPADLEQFVSCLAAFMP